MSSQKSNVSNVDMLDKLVSSIEERRATAAKSRDDSMQSALEITHAQEMHNNAIAQEQEKLKSLQLKNTASEQKMELDLVKAQAQGLAPQKDPVIQDPPKQPLPSNQAELVGLVSQRMRELQESGSPVADKGNIELNAYVRDQLLNSLKKLDDKSLRYSPLGGIGQKLGGIINTLTLGSGLGTSIFGGQMGPERKAEFLSRVLYQTSPLVRSELSDLLARDKMTEKTASERLKRSGLSGTSSLLTTNSASAADPIIATAIDIKQLVGAAVKDSFSGEATIPVGSSFDNWDSIGVATEALKEATTPEEVQIRLQEIVQHDTMLREKIRNFIANGGTKEQFVAEIGKAQDVIDNRYQKELTSIPGDAKATEFSAMQKVVANEYGNKLDKFRDEVSKVFQEEKENALIQKLGSDKYKRGKEFTGLDVSVNNAQEARAAAVAGGMIAPKSKKASPFELAETADKIVASPTKSKAHELFDKLDIRKEEFGVLKSAILDGETDPQKRQNLKKLLTEYELQRTTWKK